MRRIGILSFTFLYLAWQGYQIVDAHFRGDKRFGFWMFAESTRFRAKLYRRFADGREVYAPRGNWKVRGENGITRYRWNNFVRDFRLNRLEQERRAKVGMAVTLKYLQNAVDYVAKHTPADQETYQLVLKVEYRPAKGELQYKTLESLPRI